MNEKIGLIITDSMAMPREGVMYSDCWPVAVKKEFSEYTWIELNKRGSLMTRLVKEGHDTLEFYDPEVVIIQLGIVDCAPRKIGYYESRIIYQLPPILNSTIVKTLSTLRKRKLSRTYTKKENFKKSIVSYCRRALKLHTVKRVLFLHIAETGMSMQRKNPLIEENISIYNKIIEDSIHEYSKCEIIRPFSNILNMDDYTIDGYHFNARGHKAIADSVITTLRQCRN